MIARNDFRKNRPLLGVALVTALAAGSGVACSVGEGVGGAEGTLNVPDCWAGNFTLEPDFFAGVPFRNSVELRIQEGGDYTTYSDGLDILVRNLDAILPSASSPGLLGRPLQVRIPSNVTPPGVPLEADPSPALIDIALYLQRTCKTQNVALYAGTVAVGSDGSCELTPAPPPICRATATSTAPPVRTAESQITFQHLFNGIPEEPDATKRLTEATFDLYFAEPREICPGGLGPPPRCRGHLKGSFRFTFERGRPAQRFP